MNTNVLSSDVEIIGNLKFSQDLIIDGKIEGEIQSEGNLCIGENARVVGEINTHSLTVVGKVEGNITVSGRCELKASAEVIGDIIAGTLAIEEGAQFLGKSRVSRNKAAAPAAQEDSSIRRPMPAMGAPKAA